MLNLLRVLPKYVHLTLKSRPKVAMLSNGIVIARAFRTEAFPALNRDDLQLGLETLNEPESVQMATALWTKQQLITRITALLKCSDEQSEALYKMMRKRLRTVPPKMFTDNIQVLLSSGVQPSQILEYPKILSILTDEMTNKLRLLQQLHGLKDINDMVPFLNAPLKSLQRMIDVSQNETIPGGNRIYYVADTTGIDRATVTKFFASSIRIYAITLEKFQTNLLYCLEHMEPLDIVRHLSILSYAPASIRERLEMLKNSPLDKVKPWMIRVPDIALGKSFETVIEKGAQPEFTDSLTGIWFETYVLKRIESLLGCSTDIARTLYDKCKGTVSLVDNIELLLEKSICQEAIIQYTSVLMVKKHDLIKNIELLEKITHLRALVDVFPLCVLKTIHLKKIVQHLNVERLPGDTNRIYYFCDRTGLPVTEVTAQFARRTFMFRIPKESFLENLDLFMLHMDREDVLADLWAFKYSPMVVAERIARAKEVRGKKLMPWMVRCPNVVLEKSLQLTKENGALLGENETIVEYFCKRLGFDREITNSIFLKTPSVRNVRITKVKKVIDYLLEELDYTPHDIALNPRILMHSLQTTKKRMTQLRELGCRPSSLIIVCKSQQQYNLFVKDWIANMERKNSILQCS